MTQETIVDEVVVDEQPTRLSDSIITLMKKKMIKQHIIDDYSNDQAISDAHILGGDFEKTSAQFYFNRLHSRYGIECPMDVRLMLLSNKQLSDWLADFATTYIPFLSSVEDQIPEKEEQ